MNKNTVQKSIFSSTIINSVIIIMVFSIFFSVIQYQTNRSKAVEVIRQRNYAVSYFINGYFSEINNIIKFLSTAPGVSNYLDLDYDSQQQVLELFYNYTELNDNLTFIYSGYENGDLAIRNYSPPPGFDPRNRPWYTSAVASAPDLSTGLPYMDINNGEWLLATSKVLNDADGRIIGVISCDSSIKMITDMLNDSLHEIYKTSYSYVMTPEGIIILHPDKEYLKRDFSNIIGKPINFQDQEGLLSYSLEGSKKFAYYCRSDQADWVVITVVEKKEIIGPIIKRILGSISFTGLLAVLISFYQSYALSSRFSRPIQELRNRVHSIVNGHWDENDDFNYPENEIGIMAREIGKLTSHELYRKSMELKRVNAELIEKNDLLTKISTIDQLTGLYNRRKMDEAMAETLQVSRRRNRTFSLILFDIDFFKMINDVFGHQKGDIVLKEVASLIQKNLRAGDIACRWGGEEFLILCPETRVEQAAELGRRLCSVIQNHTFDIDKQITLSGGVSEYRKDENPDDLLKRADDCLYRAKKEGKNRVVISPAIVG